MSNKMRMTTAGILIFILALWVVVVYGDSCTSARAVFFATGSRITHVPDHIPSNSTAVYLYDNRIRIIKSTDFASLTSACVTLDLHGNEISVIDGAAFHTLNHLENLDLSGNRLSRNPVHMFPGLFFLEVLLMDGNYVEAIDDLAFSGLRTLKTLSLRHNKIKTITTQTFRGLISLENLLLSYNGLTSILECAFSSIPRPFHLALSGNHFSCDGRVCCLVEEVRQRALKLLPPRSQFFRSWSSLDCHQPVRNVSCSKTAPTPLTPAENQGDSYQVKVIVYGVTTALIMTIVVITISVIFWRWTKGRTTVGRRRTSADHLLLQVAPPDDNIDSTHPAPPPYSPEQPLLQPDLPPEGHGRATDGADGSELYHLDLTADPPPYSPSKTSVPPRYSNSNEGRVLPSTTALDVDVPEVVIYPPSYERGQPPPYTK